MLNGFSVNALMAFIKCYLDLTTEWHKFHAAILTEDSNTVCPIPRSLQKVALRQHCAVLPLRASILFTLGGEPD
jgi:hypothetical protein